MFFLIVFASSEPVPGFQGDTLQLAFIDLRQVRCNNVLFIYCFLPLAFFFSFFFNAIGMLVFALKQFFSEKCFFDN